MKIHVRFELPRPSRFLHSNNEFRLYLLLLRKGGDSLSKSLNKLMISFIVLIILMAGCSSSTPVNPYTGRDLKVGVIGDPPDILESDKVTFSSMEFEDLTSGNYKSYDAVFVMEERLPEAAADTYPEVYLQMEVPITFIGTDMLTPFITIDAEYQPKGFQKGSPYAVGLINGKNYAWGLYNDTENEEAIHLFYSDLFRLIEKSF